MKEVIIVDDSIVQRMVIKKCLEEANYKVIECSSCHEARELIKNNKPHALVLDILLPNEDGLEFLASMEVDFPVIILSSDKQPTTMEKAKSLGAQYFIFKPLIEKELLDILKEL